MKVLITEYMRIDLGTEKWECRKCDHVLGDARENYKKFTKIYARDPQEIHRPILNPGLYELNFSPDPGLCVIYEFYCPSCGVMTDVEYTAPGHLPVHDIDFDFDALKDFWKNHDQVNEGGTGPDTPRQTGCGHNHEGMK